MRIRSTLLLISGNLLVLLFALGIGEGVIRLAGYQCYGKANRIVTDPAVPYFEADSLLGYRQRAGSFDVFLSPDYSFHTTHNGPNSRITSGDDQSDHRPEIWLVGCSFTHGWALSDSATYPWKLQALMPHYQFRNWGVNGYGTLHFYLQLRSALQDPEVKPEAILLHHADFHFYRNLASFEMKRLYTEWNYLGQLTRPEAGIDSEGNLHISYSTDQHQPWRAARWSALVNFCEQKLEAWLDRRNKELARAITEKLLDEIWQLCREHQIPLILVNIAYQADFLEAFATDRELPFIDLPPIWMGKSLLKMKKLAIDFWKIMTFWLM